MKSNKNPPRWVVERFVNNRSLDIPFDFQTLANNKLKLIIYGQTKR